jgi:hypothetical protein
MAGRKGFIHIIEMLIVIMTIFIFISQTSQISKVNSEWSNTRSSIAANDILFSFERAGVDWYNSTLIRSMINSTLGEKLIVGLTVKNNVKPRITVGCVCTEAQAAQLSEMLSSTRFNIDITFNVIRIEPSEIAFKHQHDVTFLWGYHNLSPHYNAMWRYLGSGRGVVEFSALTPAQIGEAARRDLFNLEYISDTISGSTETGFTSSEPGKHVHDISRYFSYMPYTLYTVSSSAVPGVASCNSTYKKGSITARETSYNAWLIDNRSETCDVSLYIDTDGDGALGAGEGPFIEGSSFQMAGQEFTVKDIDSSPAWNHTELLFRSGYMFREFSLEKIYPNDENPEKIALAKLATYDTSGNRVPASIINYNIVGEKGRTAWISDAPPGSDVSQAVRSLVAWAAGDSYEVMTADSQNPHAFRMYKILSGDALQPVEIELVLDYKY